MWKIGNTNTTSETETPTHGVRSFKPNPTESSKVLWIIPLFIKSFEIKIICVCYDCAVLKQPLRRDCIHTIYKECKALANDLLRCDSWLKFSLPPFSVKVSCKVRKCLRRCRFRVGNSVVIHATCCRTTAEQHFFLDQCISDTHPWLLSLLMCCHVSLRNTGGWRGRGPARDAWCAARGGEDRSALDNV